LVSSRRSLSPPGLGAHRACRDVRGRVLRASRFEATTLGRKELTNGHPKFMKDVYEERWVTEARIPTDTDSHSLTSRTRRPGFGPFISSLKTWKRSSPSGLIRESARWGPGRSLDPSNAIGEVASEDEALLLIQWFK